MEIEEKLKIFQSLILAKATATCKSIEKEMEQHNREVLEASKESALESAYILMQTEVSDITSESSGEFSHQTVLLKKKLFLKRARFEDTIFAEAKDRLIDFRKSPQYEPFLMELVKRSAAEYDFEAPVICITAADQPLSLKISSAFGRACTIDVTDSFEVGGFILKDNIKGYLVDNSLDHTLEMQRIWFHTNSGLVITT